MRFIGTSKVRTDPFSQLLSRQQAIVLSHMAFAMHPFGLNRIEPRTLRGQQERQYANTCARLLDLLIVLAKPGTHGLALMPRGIIPDQEPVCLALLEQARASPLQELGGDGADRPPGHEPQPDLRAVGFLGSSLLPEHTVASQGLGIRVVLAPGLLHQPQRLLLALPGMRKRQGKAAPPDFIAKPDRPAWLLASPSDQAVPCVFFSWYCGSGLVIQCLARFQLVFRRLRARRTLSSEIGLAMIPCSKLTWAANSKVQRPRSLPKSRGLRCNKSFRRSAPSSEKAVRSRWGREDPSCRTAKPWALNSWITLRTVWSSHPSWRALAGLVPRAPMPARSGSDARQRHLTNAALLGFGAVRLR